MSAEICPVKEKRRKNTPTKRVKVYHDWKWEKVGDDEDGAEVRRGECKLCGYKLPETRFCRRCGVRLDRWGTRGSLCDFCVKERVEVIR